MTTAMPVIDTPGFRTQFRLEELAGRLHSLPGFTEVVASLQRGHGATLGGVWGSSCALVAAALARAAPGPLILVAPHIADIDSLADDLSLFVGVGGWGLEAAENAIAECGLRIAESAAADSRAADAKPKVKPSGLRARVAKLKARDTEGNPQSPIPEPQFEITDHKSQISNPQSAILPPPTANPQPLVPAISKFPAREAFAREAKKADEIEGDRLRLLKILLAGNESGNSSLPKFIVTSIQSLVQAVPAREQLRQQTRLLRMGQPVDLDEFCTWLVECGFASTSGVQMPGEFSRRGGILDLFAADWLDPVRVELWGDEIESIRRFDVGTQRSLGTLSEVDVTGMQFGVRRQGSGVADSEANTQCPMPNAQDGISDSKSQISYPPTPTPKPLTPAPESFTDYLPPGSWFLLIEPGELEDEGQKYWNRIDRPHEFFTVGEVFRQAYHFPTATAEAVAAGSLEATCHLPIESIERFSGDVSRVRQELESAAAGQDVFIVCQTEAEVHRLREIFGDLKGASATRAADGPPMESEHAAPPRLHFPLGRLQAGFRLVSERAVLLSGAELFHRTDVARNVRSRLGRVMDSFLELRKGDLVVHVAHGIARYHGLQVLEKGESVEEHLELEFDGGTKLYVPASKIELVQKYVGSTKRRPRLGRIGGKVWVRQKQRAEQAVTDMAGDLLDLQATRGSQPGISFAQETDWQFEFEAAFPYTETPDQRTAADAIRADMLRAQPADRLICGDVGFGKTELAMRAAFRAVNNGYQVAVLVPTTVLAEQHFRTFSQRMAEYPFQIARLSRFATKGQQSQIIKRCREGGVDIVIGTHRLASTDVEFHNLGLLIIDEEQRFGVEVKERLKQLRRTVDVITLTATPIPRTLHMSLLGLRDISNLETPPTERQAVETRVTRFEPELIRHAVLRELNREGQVFFVHNRVQDIEAVARRLQQIVPEATLGIGHGQMNEHELERVMLGFVNHEFDMLLATTIIESGLDIPNANTIFIDEADRYGLADLHQLRGRVGRYKHRAYCYLLVEPGKSLTPQSARRLKAIEEFSEMGAGFAISMRDLEIRGAGNILGTEQSGHINAVGYELYCSLLDRAVRQLKKMPPKPEVDVNVVLPAQAYLPRNYVADMRMKIDLYRRLARVTSEAELADIRTELVDRFGPLPEVAERLLRMQGLRLLAASWMIDSIHLEPPHAVLAYRSRPLIDRLANASGQKLRVVDGESAYLKLGKTLPEPDAILAGIEAVLRQS